MVSVWKFVDRPESSPTTLLDMNNGTTWRMLAEALDLSPPPLRRSVVQNAMTDGGIVTSASYNLRELRFQLVLSGATEDARAAQLKALEAELGKPSNLLMFKAETATFPVFFRTFRSDDFTWDREYTPNAWLVECSVMAEPFAIGTRHDIATGVLVANDPASTGPALNSNTSFEVNLTGWTGVGGALTRTTAQFHAGVASATITPDGVTATVRIDGANVSVTAGTTYRAQGWLRCAVARTVNLNVNWFNASSVYLDTGVGTVTVAANTWTRISADLVAPAGAAFASIIPTMTGTPPATNVLWADEIELRAVPGSNPLYLDVTGIRGDSPAPAFARVGTGFGAGATFVLAQRSANNPTAVTTWAQAEAGTLGTDTTTQVNDAAMSGAGNNFIRTTFATNTLIARVTVTVPTATSSEALRGRYRVFVKVRRSAATSAFTMRYRIPGGSDVLGPQVTYDVGLPNSVWMMDLGVVEFPSPGPAPAGIGYSGLTAGHSQPTLEIQAKRDSGALSLDMDYVVLMPADERMCSFRQVSSMGYIVLDGPQDMTYGMAAGTSPFGAAVTDRVIDNAGGLIPRIGGLPMLVPGVTNRWHVLRCNQDVTLSSTWDVSYWPRWREVATS